MIPHDMFREVETVDGKKARVHIITIAALKQSEDDVVEIYMGETEPLKVKGKIEDILDAVLTKP